jgi:hypothetical protein
MVPLHYRDQADMNPSKDCIYPNDNISQFAQLGYNYYSQVGLDLDEHFADVFTIE